MMVTTCIYLFHQKEKNFLIKGFLFNDKEINPISLGEFYDGINGHITLEQAREKTRKEPTH